MFHYIIWREGDSKELGRDGTVKTNTSHFKLLQLQEDLYHVRGESESLKAKIQFTLIKDHDQK